MDFPPIDPGIEIVVASHGMSKGISQTDGMQTVPKAFLQIGPAQLGAQWKNVESATAAGEGALFVNGSRSVGTFQFSLGASYKFQTGVEGPADSRSFEFNAGANRKFGKVSIRLNAIYSPDDLGGAKQSLYLEAGPTYEINKTTRLSANVGRRERDGAPDYTSFNGGVTKTLFPGFALDLRYYDTAQSGLGEQYRGRAVLSGRLSF